MKVKHIETIEYEPIPRYPLETMQMMAGKISENIPNWAVIASINGLAYWETTIKTTDHGAEAIMRLKRKEDAE